MSNPEATLIQSIAYGICAAIALVFVIRQKKGLSPTQTCKGINVSAFKATDVLCVSLLVLYYLLYIPGSGSDKPAPVAIPSAKILLLSNITAIIPALAVFLRLRQDYLKKIPGWTGHNSFLNLLVYPVCGIILVYGFISTLEYSGFNNWIKSAFDITSGQNVVNFLKQGSLSVQICVSVSALLLAPLCEECIFRGYLYPVLKKYTGFIPAILFCSFFFACIHASGLALLPLVFLGIILILLYEKTKTLWAPIIVHFLFNLTTILAHFLGQGNLPS